ncbi:MAG: type III-B CRISPR module-associated protein Cmr5 [Candidatus Bathyarchaeota archaeon]|nr:type III-B CRISPR module-associated protein Cmr5 [Candidatus Bathyarchaeota archaeon]
MLRTLEQDRANNAWNCIKKVKSLNEEQIEKRYKSFVNKSSALVLTNGLGNTLAFYRSKYEGNSPEAQAYKILYTHIDEWLKKQSLIDQDVTQWIFSEKTTSLDVIRATKEILAFVSWLKRFAAAELKGDETE